MPAVYETWSSAKELRAEDFTEAQRARFWERLAPRGDCLLWAGHVNAGGYGALAIGTKATPRSVLAHRAAHALAVGPVPQRAYVLHSCDVRQCCNPSHLSLGSHLRNMREAVERGRAAETRGERNGRARLSRQEVERLRRIYANLPRGGRVKFREAQAAELNVSARCIEAAIYGENWK